MPEPRSRVGSALDLAVSVVVSFVIPLFGAVVIVVANRTLRARYGALLGLGLVCLLISVFIILSPWPLLIIGNVKFLFGNYLIFM